MTAPNHKGIPLNIVRGGRWCGDVGALINNSDLPVKMVDLDKLGPWLKSMEPYRNNCIWIAGFDVLFDAQATLDSYAEFKSYLEGWPLAYVAQNGSESLPIPEDCAAVFIAGTTAWKESYEAFQVIQRAQTMGKAVHIGRVNWWRRFQKFAALPGSEEFTFDGNRQIYTGMEDTIAAWNDYKTRRAIVQLPLPKENIK